LDIARDDATAVFETFADKLVRVDLVIHQFRNRTPEPGHGYRSRYGYCDVKRDRFMKLAQTAMRLFLKRGSGHLVVLRPVAALRGNMRCRCLRGTKAFQSVYLDGLRELASKSGLPIAVTEAQPGFVATAHDEDRPAAITTRPMAGGGFTGKGRSSDCTRDSKAQETSVHTKTLRPGCVHCPAPAETC
jgi:NADP-dependent 3-hydroxy acid dehydrogenase YdfG